AEITRQNTILLFIKSTDTLSLSAGDSVAIRAGDRVVVGSESAGQIILADGSAVDLYEGTALTVAALAREADTDGAVRLELLSGRIFSRVQRLLGTRTFDVGTPSSTASVRGTRFGVSVLSGESSYYYTAEGSVGVSMDGAEAVVDAGEELTAVQGDELVVTGIEDLIPPSLTISSPAGSVATGSTVTVTGLTEPDAIVYVNGFMVTVDEDGAFSVEVIVEETGILVDAIDAFGNMSSVQIPAQ
nr:FecR domain-containing protein [Anaerolineae bacterium]